MPLAAVRLTVDLDALAANFAMLRDAAGSAEMAPVVKADGYGLGAGPLARRLWLEGARAFFVARLDEGEALRAALGPERRAAIWVLDGFTPGSAARLAAADLTPVLLSGAQVEAALASPAPFPCGLHVDSGMNRQGVTPREAVTLAAEDRLSVGLIMSHLGSAAEPADPRNRRQLETFRALRPLFPEARASLSASAGMFLGEAYRFDQVRPGISLFGGGPQERPDPRLRAVATLEAPILQLRPVAAGDLIGYGGKVTAERDMTLAIVAAGYADGIIRAAAGRGYAWAGGRRRRLVSVTMNMIAIDVSDGGVAAGDTVELLGPNVALDDLAAASGSVAHECLTRLVAVTDRRYRGAA